MQSKQKKSFSGYLLLALIAIFLGMTGGVYLDRFTSFGNIVDSLISNFYTPRTSGEKPDGSGDRISFGNIPQADDYAPARKIDKKKRRKRKSAAKKKRAKHYGGGELPGKNLVDTKVLRECFTEARTRTPSIPATARLLFSLDGESKLGEVIIRGGGDEKIRLTACCKRRLQSMDIISTFTQPESFYVILSEN